MMTTEYLIRFNGNELRTYNKVLALKIAKRNNGEIKKIVPTKLKNTIDIKV